MFISTLTNGGATPALVATMAYTQMRHGVIAENVANWGNPNYKTKRLDAGRFQKSLADALSRHQNRAEPFDLAGTDQFHQDDDGLLRVTPTTLPAENVLFHDGTNLSIERQMADLAENAMMHEMASTVLQGYFDGTRKAIRGRL
ncbi:MAG: flagellar basal body rod protein FlgB [Phycisphaerae bacterium]